MGKVIIPENYKSCLSRYETQEAIGAIKNLMQKKLCMALKLKRVTAPLFVDPASGLNDDLNGIERPVTFDIPDAGVNAQVVHSLAKWKRMALYHYDFRVGKGLLTDMNAVRRDEELDNLHSVYVDQWDWERVIRREDRNQETLKQIVTKIYQVIRDTEQHVYKRYPQIKPILPETITFVTTSELEDRFPELTPKEREREIAKEYGAVFLMQIGGALKSGKPHDGRAPDYDDWSLNGDILVDYPLLDTAVELSSMGIRVDEEALKKQLAISSCEGRAQLPFQKSLLAGELPLTIGGGIGQSRLCMVFLHRAHIGEVQSSIWPQDMVDQCEEHHIHLL